MHLRLLLERCLQQLLPAVRQRRQLERHKQRRHKLHLQQRLLLEHQQHLLRDQLLGDRRQHWKHRLQHLRLPVGLLLEQLSLCQELLFD
jgi:hypothetical protein